MKKDLVDENVTRQDGGRDAIPTPCGAKGTSERASFVTLLASKLRGSGCVSEASYNHRGGVNSNIDSQNPSPQPSPARGEGACSNNCGTSQSLINVMHLFAFINHFTHFTDLTHFTHLRKRFAFTLAETLITLGVIGIIAAMTIPNLVQSYNEKVTVTKVKKMYSILSNAYEMSKLENEQEFVTGTAADVKVADLFKPYLKVVKDCGNTDLSCLTDTNYKNKLGTNKVNYNRNNRYYKLALNDGSVLIFRGGQNYGDFKYNFEILYDVNGKGGPNQWGYDLFEFDEYKGQIRPCGVVKDWEQTCPTETSGYTCAAWIISKGNMDYLK